MSRHLFRQSLTNIMETYANDVSPEDMVEELHDAAENLQEQNDPDPWIRGQLEDRFEVRERARSASGYIVLDHITGERHGPYVTRKEAHQKRRRLIKLHG